MKDGYNNQGLTRDLLWIVLPSKSLKRALTIRARIKKTVAANLIIAVVKTVVATTMRLETAARKTTTNATATLVIASVEAIQRLARRARQKVMRKAKTPLKKAHKMKLPKTATRATSDL